MSETDEALSQKACVLKDVYRTLYTYIVLMYHQLYYTVLYRVCVQPYNMPTSASGRACMPPDLLANLNVQFCQSLLILT